jgi:ParB family chromosome partitioning protein
MAERKVLMVPLANIRENQDALRPVDKQTENYLGLVDSIKQVGVLNAISVREIGAGPDGSVPRAADGSILYALIDGLHRFHAASDAGLKEIPALVVDLNQAEVYEAQIVANVHKIETKPVEYTKAVQRIMALHPTRTITEQAAKLGKSSAWLKERLGLTKLTDAIQNLVNENKVVISNAYALAKLPTNEQADWVDKAMTQTPQEFVPSVNARIKQIKEDKKKGTESSPAEYIPVPHLRKFAELNEEFKTPKELPRLLSANKITNPMDAAKFVLAYVLNMDPETTTKKRAEWEARKKAQDEAAQKRAAEKAEKKAKEAAEAAAAAKAAQEDAKKLAAVKK